MLKPSPPNELPSPSSWANLLFCVGVLLYFSAVYRICRYQNKQQITNTHVIITMCEANAWCAHIETIHQFTIIANVSLYYCLCYNKHCYCCHFTSIGSFYSFNQALWIIYLIISLWKCIEWVYGYSAKYQCSAGTWWCTRLSKWSDCNHMSCLMWWALGSLARVRNAYLCVCVWELYRALCMYRTDE